MFDNLKNMRFKETLWVKIDPQATLSRGDTGIKIVGSSCYAGNKKIGNLVKW